MSDEREPETTRVSPLVGDAVEVRSARWQGPRPGTVDSVIGTPGNFFVNVTLGHDHAKDLVRWVGEGDTVYLFHLELYERLSDDQRQAAAERARNALFGAWCERPG